jgi:SAM-dependent methyltransferase
MIFSMVDATIFCMKTLESYDELPYDSLPLPETQPDFLAAMAKLHGFDAPDPAHARILELGCAQGGNLIPLAWRWPEATCVGVELSRVQAEAGADFIRSIGLSNARILHGDLAALPDDLGEFDFIIAHGVFSWVPPRCSRRCSRSADAICRPTALPTSVSTLPPAGRPCSRYAVR